MIVVCIPARNEEKTIASVLIKAKPHADKIIVCDDGSSDMTPKIAQALGAEVITTKSSPGYGSALESLFSRALQLAPDVMVTLDADGQHDPDEIPTLVKPIVENKCDIVVGSRFKKGRSKSATPAYRRAGILTITKLTETASGLKLTDAQSGFRAYGRTALRTIAPVELGMGASVELLMRAGETKLRVTEVPASIKHGNLDTSTHNPVYHGMDVVSSIFKFVAMRHPLIFFGIPGAITIVFGLGFGYFTIQDYALQAKPITNIALLSMAIVSSGLLLVFMGLILFTLSSLIKEIRM